MARGRVDALPAVVRGEDGRTYSFGQAVKTRRQPEGWQLIMRVATGEKTARVTGHALGGVLPAMSRCELRGGRRVVRDHREQARSCRS